MAAGMTFVVLADAELNVVVVAVELVAERSETFVVISDAVAATNAVVVMAATEAAAAAAVVVADAASIDAAKAVGLSARVEPQAAAVDSTAPRSAGS